MPNLGISLAVGRSATSSGSPGGGATPFVNEYSLNFDGANDFTWVGAQAELGLTGSFSLSVWVKADSWPVAGSWLISKRDYAGAAQINYQVVIYGQKVYINTSTGSGGSVVSTSTLSTGTWYNIVVTVNPGTEGKIYINGSLDKTASIIAVQKADTPLSIGAWADNAGGLYGPHDGLLDEVAVFDSLLSASDVTAIYNSGVPANLTSLSPVGWWRMGDNNSGTGTTITDQGSGENDGTLTNGPTFSSAVPPGYSNQAVDFDGANDQCNIDLTGLSGATKATFSLWYNKDTSTSYANAFGAGTLSPNLNFVGLDIGSTAIRFYCYQTDSPVSTTTLTASIAQDLGAWHHVVAVYDASITNKLTLYYDGSSVAIGTSGPTSLNAYSVANGAIGVFLANSWFPGLLDVAAVWDSALSASDVTAIYNSGVPADLTSLSPTGWWRMGDGTEDGSGTTIYDMSSNSNNGTLVNGPTYSTDTP